MVEEELIRAGLVLETLGKVGTTCPMNSGLSLSQEQWAGFSLAKLGVACPRNSVWKARRKDTLHMGTMSFNKHYIYSRLTYT